MVWKFRLIFLKEVGLSANGLKEGAKATWAEILVRVSLVSSQMKTALPFGP